MQAFASSRPTGWTKPDPMASDRSVEFGFRSARFRHVRSILDALLQTQETVRILDLGGTEDYWRIAAGFLDQHRERIEILLVNTEEHPVADAGLFSAMVADACAPGFLQGARFDLVHSNSVIEHVGDAARMAAFADTIRRLGDRYFVQTPNYWFPLEPHFRVVGFQYLPLGVRAGLSRRFNLGFFPRAKSPEEAWSNVADIRLLTARQMKSLFPEAEQRIERVAGLPKSIMAVRD